MSRRQQRDLFSDRSETQDSIASEDGKASEDAQRCLPWRSQPPKRHRKTFPKVHYERVHLTVKEVAAWYGVSVATIWRWHRTNPKFPRGHKLTAGSTRWLRSELEAYDRSFREQNS